jgi:hypothetical protein
MNNKQKELIREYCLFIMECSFLAYSNKDVSKEIIFNDLIDISKSLLLEKAIRWDELKKHNPFDEL